MPAAAETLEVGKKLVALVRENRSEDAMETLYDEKIVSTEPQGSDEMPARIEGKDAVRKKFFAWTGTHTVNSETVTGPFCGDRADRFAVHYAMNITDENTNTTFDFSEVAIYTVANGKVVEEAFLYLAP